jgi:hypothetical protein
MLKTLKFPLIYAIELLLWLPLLAGGYTTMSFVASRPIATLDLHGRSLPASWEAAVPNHGRFLQGYLIASHPAAFALGLAALLGSAWLLYRVQRAQAWQRGAGSNASATAHTIAHACVFAALAVVGYWLVTRVLIGVEPV